MRLYIAGPMTGYPEFNYPAFFRATRRLTDAGFTPINPARADGREDCKAWLDFMRRSLRDIADCDGIATLTGWQDSRGAALEVHIARSMDLPVRPVDEWLDIAAKVERSSLGTPAAKAARASVSDEQAARVVARAKELDAFGGAQL